MSISVVIASYRYGHLAAHAIDTVLSQSKKADKIFFVDDAAGDCKHLPVLYPEIEFVLREENLGVVKNFQDMLDRVNTDRCMFLGADNWLRADTLEVLDKSSSDIVTYDIIVTGTERKEILSRHPNEIEKRMGDFYWDRSSGHHGSMLYNTELAKQVGYYHEGSGRTLEDKNLYHGMLGLGATREHIPEGFLYYRRHKENFNNV